MATNMMQFTGGNGLSRGSGQRQYQRATPVPTATIYDWKLSNYYHKPILPPGQHNAFPRRLPTAGSDRLRQMYMNTDTISGRIVFDSAHERSRQRRFELLKRTVEQQARDLEERNRDLGPRPSTTVPPPSVNKSSSKKQVVPPIRSWRGMTIIKERRQHSYQPQNPDELSGDDNSESTETKDPSATSSVKLHAQMSVYLPRADLQIPEEVTSSLSKSSHSKSSKSSQSSTPRTPRSSVITPKSTPRHIRPKTNHLPSRKVKLKSGKRLIFKNSGDQTDSSIDDLEQKLQETTLIKSNRPSTAKF